MSLVLMPLPDTDFDPTEVAAPWSLLREAGHEVVFATGSGAAGRADPLVLNGVIFGQLGAEPDARALYTELERDPAFMRPLRWSDLDARSFDALYLAGGHAAGMRPFLESEVVQSVCATMWKARRPVAAICHGVLVLARTIDADTGKSVLYGRRTTCLPKYMERTAYFATAWKLGRYYRTYDAYVEEEVREALGPEGTFERGPITLFSRGTRDDDAPAFLVEDGHYVSGRWPGDAFAIGRRLARELAAAAGEAQREGSEARAHPSS
jgi:putative intracellular protease/amidase